MGLVWGLGGFGGFDTFFFSLYKALRLNVKRCLRCSRVGVIGGKWVK